MFKYSLLRSQRNKGFKVRHALQICVLIAACIWLLYQLQQSQIKKESIEENTNISEKVRSTTGILRLGRKEGKDIDDHEHGLAKRREESEVKGDPTDKEIRIENREGSDMITDVNKTKEEMGAKDQESIGGETRKEGEKEDGKQIDDGSENEETTEEKSEKDQETQRELEGEESKEPSKRRSEETVGKGSEEDAKLEKGNKNQVEEEKGESEEADREKEFFKENEVSGSDDRTNENSVAENRKDEKETVDSQNMMETEKFNEDKHNKANAEEVTSESKPGDSFNRIAGSNGVNYHRQDYEESAVSANSYAFVALDEQNSNSNTAGGQLIQLETNQLTLQAQTVNLGNETNKF